MNLDPNAIIEGVDVQEDEDAGHRQRKSMTLNNATPTSDEGVGIRKAVLEGDVEKALKYTHAYYPNVLKDNEHVSFRLKCRKYG